MTTAKPEVWHLKSLITLKISTDIANFAVEIFRGHHDLDNEVRFFCRKQCIGMSMDSEIDPKKFSKLETLTPEQIKYYLAYLKQNEEKYREMQDFFTKEVTKISESIDILKQIEDCGKSKKKEPEEKVEIKDIGCLKTTDSTTKCTKPKSDNEIPPLSGFCTKSSKTDCEAKAEALKQVFEDNVFLDVIEFRFE